MQLGMIGLGRMGANMVRRLMKDGHQCVVFDMLPKAVEELAAERATGAASLAGLRQQAGEAARHLADGAGRRRRPDHRTSSSPLLEPGDILIDGGNSYYIDDIRRAKELARQGDPLRRRRHQRRRLGPRARLLHDDRRRRRRPCSTSIRSSRRSRPGRGDIARTPGREKVGGTAEHGYLHCGPNGAGHFVKMVHNGIEYGIMAAYAEGLDILRARQRRQADARRSTPRPRRCAIPSTTSTTSTCATSPRSGGAAA